MSTKIPLNESPGCVCVCVLIDVSVGVFIKYLQKNLYKGRNNYLVIAT